MKSQAIRSNHYTKSKVIVFSVLVFAGVFFTLKSSFFCSQATALCTHSSNQLTSTQIAPYYYTYSDTLLNQSLKNGKTVVLYFYAPWCTSCTGFDQEVKDKSQQLPPETIILQVPYDTSPDLRATYNVNYQHTLVLLDRQGKTQEMWIGGDFASVLEYLHH